MDQQVGVLKHGLHALLVSDEIGRKVTPIELHALNHVEGGLGAFGFLDGNGSVFPNFVHGISYDVSDGTVAVGGDGADLGYFAVIFY